MTSKWNDPVIENLRKQGAVYPGTATDEEIWNDYTHKVIPMLDRAQRKQAIAYIDRLVDEGGSQITRQTASLLRKRRDLTDMDDAMYRSNR